MEVQLLSAPLLEIVRRRPLMATRTRTAVGGTVDLVRLGAALADARRAAGLTQDELARRAGKKQADISKIENGKNEPTLQTLANFARILRIDPVLLAAQAFRD